MKQADFTILENKKLTENVRLLYLQGDTSGITRPGQFVNLKLEGRFLRRPLSVCDREDGRLTLIYKIAGAGTGQLSLLPAGTKLDLLTGLGNGYDLREAGPDPLVIGGGVGIPPLYYVTRELIAAGRKVTAVLGFNTAGEIFYTDEFRSLGANVLVTTADGSYGIRGFVTDALPGLDYSVYYACGPEPMLKAVWQKAKGPGQLSFEERMGCGFGACMGCTCRTVTGYKRICKEGPVLRKEEILWNA